MCAASPVVFSNDYLDGKRVSPVQSGQHRSEVVVHQHAEPLQDSTTERRVATLGPA
jgi:hypothetical protein